jgi:hypothetical protein
MGFITASEIDIEFGAKSFLEALSRGRVPFPHADPCREDGIAKQ